MKKKGAALLICLTLFFIAFAGFAEASNSPLVINKVTNIDTYITGKSDIGNTITVKKVNQVIGSGTVSSNGVFTVKIKPQGTGTILTVISKTKDNKYLNKKITVTRVSFLMNKNYEYEYKDDYNQVFRYRFSKTCWYEQHSSLYHIDKETKDGLYGLTAHAYEKKFNPDLLIKYPIKLNQKWISHGQSFQIVGVNLKVTTPAGTFTNVVEVKSWALFYYAPNVGSILAKDDGGIEQLTKLTKIK